MARRKKEPRSAHRAHIAEAARKLFTKKGIERVSMDDIAKEAGYSKATLYVYFKNREEILGVLVLNSMKQLYESLSTALDQNKNTYDRYLAICLSLFDYEQEYPLYFQLALSRINIDFTSPDYLPEEKETFDVGEAINQKLRQFLEDGIAANELRPDLSIGPTIFSFWGMLSGLLHTASQKEAYISQELSMNRQEFFDYGVKLLYRSILTL
ncbi:MAG: TetR/AcrR family transcriptional regulator [Clostridiales bacterium]|nr:TetR/AcrR family transcriptional regulator [Clostridiales bacterium]